MFMYIQEKYPTEPLSCSSYPNLFPDSTKVSKFAQEHTTELTYAMHPAPDSVV